MSRATHLRSGRRFALLICFCLLVLFVWSSRHLAAQEMPTKPAGQTSTEQQMAAVAADRPQQAPNLQPMAATPCVSGFAGPYPCNNVDLLAFMPLSAIGGGGNTNDIWGWTDPLDGTEYAIVGKDTGTAFVDISDPENPIYLGSLPAHSSASLWRGLKVYEDYVFIGSEASSHGLQIFDLTELRDVNSPPVTFTETDHYNGFSNSHTIAINEDTGFAYAAGSNTCSGGLHMVNIQDPLNATNAGCFSSDGYTHETQCVVYHGPDTTYTGHEICMNSNEDTLTIVDVTNKSLPVQLSRTGYSGSGYTHQGWFTEDQTYFLLDDELDETGDGHNTYTYIWNVSDLDNPDLLGHYTGPTPSIDHNLYILGDYAFESNYTAGLRILDITDIANANLTEAAFFDLYPDDDNPNFSGTWSNYPYFESGVVIATSIDEGFFILQPNLSPDFHLDADDEFLTVCAPASDSTSLDLTARNGYTGTVTLDANGLPAGSTSTFDNNVIIVPGSSTFTVTVNSTPAGTYPFTIEGTDGTITHEIGMSLGVFTVAAGSTTLLTPANGATNQSPQPTFTWSAAANTASYTIEIATDPSFNSVVDSATVNGTSYTPDTSLAAATTYYWRVRANNPCGSGAFSAPFSFTTSVCATPNLDIPDDDTNGVTTDLVLAGTTTIDDLDVSILVDHTYVGDLVFELTHVDTGSTVIFVDRPGYTGSGFGCSGDDIDATLDDEASDPVEDECAAGTPTIDGTFSPNNVLSAFDGESIGGTWRITASDHAGQDTGTLIEWCVLAISAYAANLTPFSNQAALPGETVVHHFTLANSGSSNDAYTVALDSGDWPTTLLTSSAISLTAGTTTTIDVEVDIPVLETILASDTFTLTVESQGDPGLVLTAAGQSDAAVSPDITTSANLNGNAAFGEAITYTIAVTNTGDYTDTFTVSIGGNNWSTVANPTTTGPLAPGQSTTIEVVVTVGNGVTDTVTVTFTSALDPAITSAVTLMTVSTSGHNLYLPVIRTDS